MYKIKYLVGQQTRYLPRAEKHVVFFIQFV